MSASSRTPRGLETCTLAPCTGMMLEAAQRVRSEFEHGTERNVMERDKYPKTNVLTLAGE
jgi:hypothetical protein